MNKLLPYYLMVLLSLCSIAGAAAIEVPFAGEGTEASPYLIQSKQDLIDLGHLTSAFTDAEYSVVQTFPGKYFLITDDIDLEYSDEFHGISVIENRLAWQSVVVFAGHIDGGGHTIHRMKVGEVKFSVSPEESETGYATLLGSAEQRGFLSFIGRLCGSLKNLNIAADCEIVGYSQTAGLVAEARNGALIENCRNYADVLSYASGAGGIVADLYAGATVRNCYNAGNVTTGMLIAGGIAGRSAGTIECCANAGDVQSLPLNHNVNLDTNPTLMQLVGGITGDILTGNGMYNCVNAGYVHGYTKVGGLCSIIPSASNCLNFGLVSAYDPYGGGQIFGEYNSKYVTFLENLYYDTQVTIHGIGAGILDLSYCYGKTASELTSGTLLPGLEETVWDYRADCYPVPALFADEPRLAQLRAMVLIPADGQTITNIRSDVVLGEADGLEWSVDPAGSNVTVVPGLLQVPGHHPVAEQLTLTATMSDATRSFPLTIAAVSSLFSAETATDAEVVRTDYYDMRGVRLASPQATGAVIAVTTYSDGSTTINKIIK